jgi:phosphoglycolate phosphatase-like HAD superfamily hydrolase
MPRILFARDVASLSPSVALQKTLEAARKWGPEGVLAFDLDSTLFDNRPRQAKIVRDFGKAKGLSRLQACKPEDFVSGWDLEHALLRCGLSQDELESCFVDVRRFWQERFFTSAYCIEDVPIPGAKAYLDACLKTAAQLIFITGRPDDMEEGTIACLKRHGMPTPGGRVHLLMKPAEQEDDDAFKRQAHSRIPSLGELIAVFDNEPTHINDYAARFPDAFAFWLDTGHSGRDVQLHPSIISIRDFKMS